MWEYLDSMDEFVKRFAEMQTGDNMFAHIDFVKTSAPIIYIPFRMPNDIDAILRVRVSVPTGRPGDTVLYPTINVQALINRETKTCTFVNAYGNMVNNRILDAKIWTPDEFGCSCCPEKTACRSYIKKRVIKEAADMACTSELLQRSNAKDITAHNAIELTEKAYHSQLMHLQKHWSDVWEYDIIEMRRSN